MEVFDEYLEMTNSPSAPWYVVNAKSRKWAELQVLETLTEGIEIALQNKALAVPLLQNVFPLVKMPKLDEIPLDEKVDEKEYKAADMEKEFHNQISVIRQLPFKPADAVKPHFIFPFA